MKLALAVLTAAVAQHTGVVEVLHTVVEVVDIPAAGREIVLVEVVHRIDLAEAVGDTPVEDDSLAEEDTGRPLRHRSLAVGSSWVRPDEAAVVGRANDLEVVGSLAVVDSLVEEDTVLDHHKAAAGRSLYTYMLAISVLPRVRYVPPP